jgi:hypothetical protein
VPTACWCSMHAGPRLALANQPPRLGAQVHIFVVPSRQMAPWTLILLFALIKIPLLAFMLWLPFRGDDNTYEPGPADVSEDDGGIKAPGGGSGENHPRRPQRHGPRPRRGPHGGAPAPSPERMRSPLVHVRHVSNR